MTTEARRAVSRGEHDGDRRTPLRPWRVFMISFLGLAAISIAWALATPLGGSVDEPSHMIRAEAVDRGELVSHVPDGRGNVLFEVSPTVWSTWSQLCFVYNHALPASCSPPVKTQRGPLALADTGSGRYDPVYYSIVGWTTLALPGAPGLYAMRVVSALLCSALLALAALATSRLDSPLLPGALLVAFTPMVLSMNAGVNPNSLEIAAGVAMFSLAIAHVLRPSRRWMVTDVVGMSISAILLANARSISPLWVVLLGGAALAMVTPRRWSILVKRKSSIVILAAAVLGCLASTIWTFAAQALAPGTLKPGVGTSFFRGFATVLADTLDYAHQWIGVFGWNYIPLPGIVLFGWGAALAALVVAALLFGSGRRRWVLLALVVALVLVPPTIQGASVDGYGYVWQGRYVLVLVPPIVILSALILARPLRHLASVGRHGRTLLVVTGGFVVIGQIAGIVVTMKQFSVAGEGWRAFLTAPQWVPPGGLLLPIVLAGLGSVACVWAYRRPTRHIVRTR